MRDSSDAADDRDPEELADEVKCLVGIETVNPFAFTEIDQPVRDELRHAKPGRSGHDTDDAAMDERMSGQPVVPRRLARMALVMAVFTGRHRARLKYEVGQRMPDDQPPQQMKSAVSHVADYSVNLHTPEAVPLIFQRGITIFGSLVSS